MPGRTRAVTAVLAALAGCVAGPPSSATAMSGCSYGTTRLSVADAGSPGAHRTVLVQRPAGRDSARTPIVYLLHGFPGSPTDFVAGGVVPALERAACAAGSAIVIAEPDGTQGGLDTEWADDVDGRADLESFVTGPVITAVEGGALRPRSRRSIAGFSMGGFGAAAIGLRHPDLYQRVIAVAGYYHLDDPDHVFGNTPASYRRHQPDVIAAPAHQGFFLVDGDQDQLDLTANETARFARVLRTRKIPVTAHTVPGGHDVKLLSAAARSIVAFVRR